MDLESAFALAVTPVGRRASWSALQFVDAWEFFVESVTTGFGGDIYEFEHVLSVSDAVEQALSDERLCGIPEWARSIERIDAADARLRAVLARGPRIRSNAPWWRERLPESAGEEMVADALRLFQVSLEVA